MSDAIDTSSPFRLPLRPRWLASTLERLLGLSALERCHASAPKGQGTEAFLQGVLDHLEVTLEAVDPGGVLERLPSEGPLLVVANHPLGGLEGVAITRLLMAQRPDIKVLTNELLTRIPELSDTFIGVDVLSRDAGQANVRGLREANQHLQNGGALLMFPAGKVAAVNPRSRSIEEHPWHRVAGRLMRRSGANCLPIRVEGANSWLFYALGLVHPLLRTLQLPRELANKRGKTLRLVIGESVTSAELRHLDGDVALTNYLRLSTEVLKSEGKVKKQSAAISFEPIADVSSRRDSIDQALAAIAPWRLLETDPFDVYCAPYAELGCLIEEIGVAREITFRAAGEGTGNRIDSDRFDPHYEHLFVWDKNAKCVVGGYRIGRTREIVDQHGIDALYSRTLYDFDVAYLDKIGNPLEMGRSFVHPDYQRQPKALDLLWRGIGHYVASNPEYHTLFGAVSISNEHSDLARAFIADSMLESFAAEPDFRTDVRPLEPLRAGGRVWTPEMLAELNHVSLINKLVGRCDPGKSLPTLLRHYLSLNGRFVCFSVNRVFNDSLDGLILVDLRKTSPKYLNRYLGKEGAQRFLDYWKQVSAA